MKNSELKTEQIILNAAESEFLEKGYGNTKMMAIAKRAGVSHSMLHYYFRTKENLFQTIFLKKAQTLSSFFEGIFEQQLSFSETVRLLIETQFDFVAQNPKVPHFLLTEILTNKENRTLLLEVLSPKTINLLDKVRKMVDEETEKKRIRPINFLDFILNIVSINISSFIIEPILQDTIAQDSESMESLLNKRRESNVQFILAALRP